MTREDRRIVKFCVAALVMSFSILWLVAELGTIGRPWDEYDKKCMSKTALELTQCINDVKKEKYPNG